MQCIMKSDTISGVAFLELKLDGGTNIKKSISNILETLYVKQIFFQKKPIS